jgi:hypothetical protein
LCRRYAALNRDCDFPTAYAVGYDYAAATRLYGHGHGNGNRDGNGNGNRVGNRDGNGNRNRVGSRNRDRVGNRNRDRDGNGVGKDCACLKRARVAQTNSGSRSDIQPLLVCLMAQDCQTSQERLDVPSAPGLRPGHPRGAEPRA